VAAVGVGKAAEEVAVEVEVRDGPDAIHSITIFTH
jgi:hypothetical protein